MRGGGDGAGDRLGVDVAEVLEREAVGDQPAIELADGDAPLRTHEAGGAVDVEYGGEPIHGEHHAVGAGDVAEGVPGAGYAYA